MVCLVEHGSCMRCQLSMTTLAHKLLMRLHVCRSSAMRAPSLCSRVQEPTSCVQWLVLVCCLAMIRCRWVVPLVQCSIQSPAPAVRSCRRNMLCFGSRSGWLATHKNTAGVSYMGSSTLSQPGSCGSELWLKQALHASCLCFWQESRR